MDPLKKIRKRFRARKNTRRLEKELDAYEKRFSELALRVPAERDLSKALASACRKKDRSATKGDLRILAVYHHYNWEDESLKPALEAFGRVDRYDWGDRFGWGGAAWFPKGKTEMNRDLLAWVDKKMAGDPADMIFCYLSGENVYPETVAKIASYGALTVNMFLNDKESFVGKSIGGQAAGSRDICRHFHLCWTSTEDAVKKYCVEGALPLYMPEGANPGIHRPYPAPRDIDVSFIGQCYGERPGVIAALDRAGIQVEAFGYGWPNGPLPVEDMVKMYSRSRINLGFGGVDGRNDTFCLKGRDFEIPMSGGLYLTHYHPELESAYKIGEEIATYTNTEDLIDKIQYLLAHPEKRQAIRKSGYERARTDHTWELRFEKIFRLAGLIR